MDTKFNYQFLNLVLRWIVIIIRIMNYHNIAVVVYCASESLSVDWINNKLYWTDVRERSIGVLDLSNNRNYKHNLLSTVDNLSPRGIAVDPTTR